MIKNKINIQAKKYYTVALINNKRNNMKLYIPTMNKLFALVVCLSLIQPKAQAISLNSLSATLSQNKTAACLIGSLVVASSALGYYAYTMSCKAQDYKNKILDLKTKDEAKKFKVAALEQEYWALDSDHQQLKADSYSEHREVALRHFQTKQALAEKTRLADQLAQTNKSTGELLNATQANLAQAQSIIGSVRHTMTIESLRTQASELITRHNARKKILRPEAASATKKVVEQELTEIDTLLAQAQVMTGNTIQAPASSAGSSMDQKHSKEPRNTTNAPITTDPLTKKIITSLNLKDLSIETENIIKQLQAHRKHTVELQEASQERVAQAHAQEQLEKESQAEAARDEQKRRELLARKGEARAVQAQKVAREAQQAKEAQAEAQLKAEQAQRIAIKEQARAMIPAYRQNSMIQSTFTPQLKRKLKRKQEKIVRQLTAANTNTRTATPLATWLWSWFFGPQE